MSVEYIKPTAKLMNSLINDKTTIDHQLGAWLLDYPVDSLDSNALDATYSIPTGLCDPAIKDICGVHLINHAGVVVTEQLDISYTGEWEFADLIDAMIDRVDKFGYVVIIESVRGGEVACNACAVNSSHLLLAVSVAFSNLVCHTYEDLSSEDYQNVIKGCLEEQARSGLPLIITLDNGNSYALKAVSSARRFEKAFSTNVVG